MINQLLVCLVQYYAIDNKAGLKYTYTYDENRKHATKVTVTNTAGGAQKYVKNISYDGYDRVTTENYGSAIYSRTVSYPDSNDSPQERFERVKHTVNGISASNTTYEYDGLNRLTKEKVGKSSSSSSLVFENRYEYYAGKSGTNETTGLVRKEEYYLKNITAPQGSIEYEYDANGNVTEIKNLLDTGKNVSYEYDSLNRLTKETNLAIGSEWRYTYDNGGNITKKEEYNPSTGALVSSRDYGYGHSYWKDQLTSWGSYGTNSFVYDDSGNPTKYKGKTLEWEGKRLAKYNESDKCYVKLNYDGNGLLAGYFYSNTYSIWGGATFTTTMTREITRDGDRILSEKVTEYNPETNSTSVKNIMYAYDEKGVSGMTVGGKKYYFVRNIFGDVTAIYNTSRVKCAEYAYDAWGTMYITLDTEGVGTLNPFRYRGYYMVSCIGLYYLTTRFYDYMTGRFLNADVPSVGIESGFNIPEGCNLYSYCLNNPVMYSDETGYSPLPWWGKLLIGIGFIVVGAAVTALTAGTGAGFMAAFGAALLTSTKAVAVSTAISAGIGFAVGGLTTGTWDGAINGMLESAVDGFMWGGIFAGGAQILSAGFKGLAKLGVPTGKTGGIAKTGFMSPDKLRTPEGIAKIANRGQKFYDYGGTLLKFGKYAHIDVSTKSLLHMHLFFTQAHLPLGTVLAGIIGGF